MSEDRFDKVCSDIKIEGDLHALIAYEGEHFESSFKLSCADSSSLRGMVFSSNPYVVAKNPSFEGEQIEVLFFVKDGIGHSGDWIEGEFHIILDGYSTDIPFSIEYQSPVIKVNDRTITTLSDFGKLYRSSPTDALSFFSTDEFEAFMKTQKTDEFLLYRGYKSFPKTYQNLEEFLVALGLKARTGFFLSDTSLTFNVEDQDLRESIDITKTEWGYAEINVESDSEFITVGHEKVNDDYFIAGTMHFDFYIHPNKMHAGKNYARLIFSSYDEEKVLTVLCVKEASESVNDIHRLFMRSKVRLTREYIEYRFKRMDSEKWCESLTGLLDTLISVSPENATEYLLMKTHALILTEKKIEALSYVEELKVLILDKKGFEWAYLLYLCTMIEREKGYVDKLTLEVEAIFRDTDDPRVFWLLLFLRERYIDNPFSELKDIRQFVTNRLNSPFFYIEALYLMEKDPLLIKSFDDFTLKVLRWAANKNRITGNIALRIATLLSGEKSFDKRVFDTAAKAYSKSPTQELLNSILRYLLRNAVYGPMALPWYFLAIKADYAIAGLYEAFVTSLPEDYLKLLPEGVIRYFGYRNTIGYQKKAFVFRNLIENKDSYQKIYEDLKKTIELFALENMRRGRLSEDLCIIYQDVLDRGIIDEDVSKMIGNILIPFKVQCMPKDTIRVHLVSLDRNEISSYPVTNHVAFLPIGCKEYRIFLERKGNIFTAEEGLFVVEKLLSTEKIMDKLYLEAKDRLPYFRYALASGEAEKEDGAAFMEKYKDDAFSLIEGFLSDKSIPVSYKNMEYWLFIPYLREHMREDIFKTYLLSEEDMSEMDTKTLAYTADLFVKNEEYERAFELLDHFYGLKMTARLLLSLVTEKIKKAPDVPDDFLISTSAYLMGLYLINDVTARYLSNFYVGPTDIMCDIFKHLSALNLPTDVIGERIITESLYTEEFPKMRNIVFESYLKVDPNRMIAEAWFTYFARAFMKNLPDTEESIFPHLMESYVRGEKLNESCFTALLKYLCTKQELSEPEEKALSMILSDAVRRGLYFGFYRSVQKELQIRYQLYDKYFVTYEGEEGRRLLIRVLLPSGGTDTLEMAEMYPGIYVSQFVLFFGDKMNYEITEKNNEAAEIKKGELSCTDENSMDRESRYGLLNRMRSSFVYYEEKELLNAMKRYKALYYSAEELFSLRR
ncbi:MAG: DUF5717 family protein [Lachnospiraceae bacterium]|nr:DUF5717 family protein [Lachnospiraceae bacterium]